jgi:hypothetical protein
MALALALALALARALAHRQQGTAAQALALALGSGTGTGTGTGSWLWHWHWLLDSVLVVWNQHPVSTRRYSGRGLKLIRQSLGEVGGGRIRKLARIQTLVFFNTDKQSNVASISTTPHRIGMSSMLKETYPMSTPAACGAYDPPPPPTHLLRSPSMMMCKEGGRWNQAPNKKSAEWWCGGATTNEIQKASSQRTSFRDRLRALSRSQTLRLGRQFERA